MILPHERDEEMMFLTNDKQKGVYYLEQFEFDHYKEAIVVAKIFETNQLISYKI